MSKSPSCDHCFGNDKTVSKSLESLPEIINSTSKMSLTSLCDHTSESESDNEVGNYVLGSSSLKKPDVPDFIDFSEDESVSTEEIPRPEEYIIIRYENLLAKSIETHVGSSSHHSRRERRYDSWFSRLEKLEAMKNAQYVADLVEKAKDSEIQEGLYDSDEEDLDQEFEQVCNEIPSLFKVKVFDLRDGEKGGGGGKHGGNGGRGTKK